MRELLYYPNFNIQNENWLKYALLYVEKLRPIIPYTGLDSLYGSTKLAFKETNLISPYSPNFDNSNLASTLSLEIFEMILKNERRYRNKFNLQALFDSRFKPECRDTILYFEKYTYEFGEYCINEGFAERCNEGILMPKQVADIFMTVLSNFISEFEGISSITDNTETFNSGNIVRLMRPIKNSLYEENIRRVPRHEKVAIMSIGHSLPRNIKDISVEEIIKLRNSNGYFDKIKAFNTSLDEYVSSIQNGNSGCSFQDYLNESKMDIISSINALSNELYAFVLGIAFYLNGAPLTNLVGTMLQGGAVISGTRTVYRNYEGDYKYRQSRKLLADISRIPI